MSQNYNVYVQAIFAGIRDNKSPSASNLRVLLSVSSAYKSDVAEGGTLRGGFLAKNSKQPINGSMSMTNQIKYNSAQKSFVFPCDSLTSDDGLPTSQSWNTMSNMMSEENIPFGLDRLQWGGPKRDDCVPLASQDDLIRRILDVARSNIGRIATDAAPKELSLLVTVTKETILPHQEFLAMVNSRISEERVRDVSAAISLMIEQERIAGRPRMMRDSVIGNALREIQSLNNQAIRESGQRAKPKPIPAAQSSIEALEVVLYNEDDTTKSCAICMEKLEVGVLLVRLPCSHVFNKDCIVLWLEKSHMCPLCRFKLPTI